jgi:hypothetical protein
MMQQIPFELLNLLKLTKFFHLSDFSSISFPSLRMAAPAPETIKKGPRQAGLSRS